jgi:hypothetical protein
MGSSGSDIGDDIRKFKTATKYRFAGAQASTTSAAAPDMLEIYITMTMTYITKGDFVMPSRPHGRRLDNGRLTKTDRAKSVEESHSAVSLGPMVSFWPDHAAKRDALMCVLTH